MSRKLELATSNFIVTAFGVRKANDVLLEVEQEDYKYPEEIHKKIGMEWRNLLESKAKRLNQEGIRTEIREADPLPELYAFRDGTWKRVMFAGPQVKLLGIETDGKVIFKGQRTNYAARQVTSIDSYKLLKKYGLNGISFSLAQSAVVLLPSEEGYYSPSLHRLLTVGEYSGYIGTSAAGTVNRYERDGLTRHILLEMYEETGIVPTDDANELKRLGIIKPGAETRSTYYENRKAVVVKQRGKERMVFVDENLLRNLLLLGTVTDIYVGEPGKQYVKPENAWFVKSKVPSGIYYSSEVWRGERDEHDDVSMVPWDRAEKWLLENYSHYGERKGLMGCSAGVTALAIAYTRGGRERMEEELKKLVKRINERYPITSHLSGYHPLLRMLQNNEIPEPNELLTTTVRF